MSEENTTARDELLPCPFCGGTEQFVERSDYSSAFVQCDSTVDENCSCMARGPLGVQDDDGEELPGADAAIRAWNRRAAPASQQPTQPRAAAHADLLEAPPMPEPDYPAGTKGMLCEDCMAVDTVQARDAIWAERVRAALGMERGAVVYPPDGTVSPFTVINLGSGKVKMGDAIHDGRLPALWFGKDGLGVGVVEDMNRAAAEGETLAVVTFSNVEGLDVLLEVVQRIRGLAFPDAAQPAASTVELSDEQIMALANEHYDWREREQFKRDVTEAVEYVKQPQGGVRDESDQRQNSEG